MIILSVKDSRLQTERAKVWLTYHKRNLLEVCKAITPRHDRKLENQAQKMNRKQGSISIKISSSYHIVKLSGLVPTTKCSC